MSDKKLRKLLISGILLLLLQALYSQDAVVENVSFAQRTDGSLLVDIYYDVQTAGGLPLEISIEASGDNGETWDLPCSSLSGDIGEYITEGTGKHVLWDFYADNPDTSGNKYKLRVIADCMVCGEEVTEDLTLTRDIICNGYEYNMGGGYIFLLSTPGITLDLGGYKILSDSFNFGSAAIWLADAKGATIKNGTIDKGFSWGIGMERSDSVWIEDMFFRNMEFSSGDTFVMGVGSGDCYGIMVKDCQFEYLEVHHKESVVFGGGSFVVDNIDVKGGSVGVNISGSGPYAVGTVKNSRFEGNRISGVLVHATTDALITHNVFERGGGVNTDGGMGSEISGLIIEENEFLNGGEYDGISFRGTTGAIIRNNTIRNFNTGISMGNGRGCGPDSIFGGSCVYSTGNIITGNVVLGNNLDLEHDVYCIGNTWENNIYETARGEELYENGPSTAKYDINAVNSAATAWQSDAALILVSAGDLDTLGQGIKWHFNYASPSQQTVCEFWYLDQRVINRGLINEPYPEDLNPIPDNWIDSDSVISITENNGGRDFRNQFELEVIEMGLVNTHSCYWVVHYIAKDSSFSAQVDMEGNYQPW